MMFQENGKVLNEILSTSGAIAIITALSAWLSKVWANRILQKDRVRYDTQMETLLQDLRKRSDKELFVHRLQFEKEFNVYLELWQHALRAGRAAVPFRFLTYSTGQPHDADVASLREAYKKLNDVVYDFRPFYVPRVYELATGILKSLSSVHSLVRDPLIFQEKFQEVDELVAKVNDEVPNLCDAIRDRLFVTSSRDAMEKASP